MTEEQVIKYLDDKSRMVSSSFEGIPDWYNYNRVRQIGQSDIKLLTPKVLSYILSKPDRFGVYHDKRRPMFTIYSEVSGDTLIQVPNPPDWIITMYQQSETFQQVNRLRGLAGL